MSKMENKSFDKSVINDNNRLFTTIKPVHYEIIIKPNMKNFTFKGKVSISIDFSNFINSNFDVGKKFAIHSKNLDITKVMLKKTNENMIDLNYTINEINEILIIDLDNINNLNGLNNLETIVINYTGKLNDDLRGFYKSSYITKNNNIIENNWIATTQFESTDARRAFPCFDEPNFKSTFDIIIIHDSNLIALSNEDIKSTYVKNNLTVTSFKKTPMMSTYLVAFVIGKFGYVEGFSKSNKRIRIYATNFEKQSIEKMNFAKNIAIKCLEWFEDYFQIPYPISKMDLIAIPDFKSGAMENWGLITFRPETLLCDETDIIENKINVVMTIAHEIAHQWFGNYVTMEYWNYLWLNESMATYYGWLLCDNLFPHWKVWDIFMKKEYSTALDLDSLASSHQIEFNSSTIKHSNDIDQYFDAISYSKGACLIRGLVEKISHKTFQQGMQIYMTKHAWQNTTSNDLWNAFNLALMNDNNNENNKNIDIKSLMNSWLTRVGYPVVKLNCDTMTLTQFRFLKSGKNIESQLWDIPINIAMSNGEHVNFLMSEKIKQLEQLSCKPNECQIIINPQRFGFYRVMYDMQNYSIDALPFKINNLDPSVISNLLDDAFSLGFSGYQKLEIAISMLKYLNLEKINDYNLWHTILSNVTFIEKLLNKYNEHQLKWNKFIKKIIAPHVKKLLNVIGKKSKSGESVNNQHLRPLLINFLNLINDEDIVEYSKKMFYRGKHEMILNCFIKNSSNEEFQNILNILGNDIDPHYYKNIIESLGYANNEHQIECIMEYILNSKIKNHHVTYLLQLLSQNKYGTNIIWKYAKQKWNNCNIFNDDSSKITHLVKVLAAGFNTEKELNEYKNFFKNKPNGTEMVIEQTIEKITNKINCLEKILELINDW